VLSGGCIIAMMRWVGKPSLTTRAIEPAAGSHFLQIHVASGSDGT
jgi:hypothetical protein